MNGVEATSFIEEIVVVDSNYSDCAKWVEIPTGHMISTIVIKPSGRIGIEGVRLEWPRANRCIYPIPPSILRTRPSIEPSVVYLCFIPEFDLRKVRQGDIRLGLSICGFRKPSDDKIAIAYSFTEKL